MYGHGIGILMSYLKNQGIVGLLGGGYEMANFLVWQIPTIHPVSNQLLRRLIGKMPADEIQSTYSLSAETCREKCLK